MRSVFLSYGRGDDEPFAEGLCQALKARGLNVWYDREAMPSRSLTFHQEIRDAIAACERLVLIVGPHAAASEYVQQEWQFALQADKVVTPILRAGDYPLVPDELKLLHCEDFRDDTRFEFHLDNLARQLSEPPPPLGKLIAVPSLPLHYLARTERLKALRDAVRADLDRPVVLAGATARVGMQGMGGIGKSVLASALTRDRQVREAFPDGIVWIGLGSLPMITDLQRQVYHALGGDGGIATEHEGKNKLREFLANKSVLLVLDDVWRRSDADAFNVLGPRCRALITTRDAGLLTSLNGTHHIVELLTDAEALELLSKTTGVPRNALPQEANDIVVECGRLPLAVSLCGSLVHRNMPWLSVLEQLQQARIDRIADRHAVERQHQSVWHAIHISVKALQSGEKDRFLELGVFPSYETTPQPAAVTLWEQTGSLDAWATEELLTLLTERSLVQMTTPASGTAGPRRFGLHPLIYDYTQRARSDHRELHNKLLSAYQKKCTSGWPSGPNDGYFFTHLRNHLFAADRVPELADLLHDLRWLEAKNQAGLTFDLPFDFRIAINALSTTDDRHRILRLLDQALRRDIHFIARHAKDYPQTLFQCLWNSCWWYDCPEAAGHYQSTQNGKTNSTPTWPRSGPKLHALMEQWRDSKSLRGLCQNVWRQSRRAATSTVFQYFSWAIVCTLISFLPIRSSTFLSATLTGLAIGVLALVHAHSFSKIMRRTISVGAGVAFFWGLNWLGGRLPWLVPVLTAVAIFLVVLDDLVVGFTRLWCQRVLFWLRLRTLKRHERRGGFRWLRSLRPPLMALDELRVTILSGHEQDLAAVAVSPNGIVAASVSSDGTMRLWDLNSGGEMVYIDLPSGPVARWLEFSPDGQRVLVGSEASILTYSCAQGQIIGQLIFGQAPATLFESIPSGRALVLPGCRTIVMVDENGCLGTEIRMRLGDQTFGADDSDVPAFPDSYADCCLRSSPDGRRLLTQHLNQEGNPTFRLWDSDSGRLIAESDLDVGAGGASKLTVASSGCVAVVPVGARRKVLLWQPSFNQKEIQWLSHPQGEGKPLLDQVEDIAFSYDSRLVAAGFNDGTVVVWETDGGTVVATDEGHSRKVCCLSFSFDGSTIVSGAADRTIRCWQIQQGELSRVRQTRIGNTDLIIRHEWLNDSFLVADDMKGQRALYNLLNGRCLCITQYQLEAIHYAVAFTIRDTRLLGPSIMFRFPAGTPDTAVARIGELVGIVPGMFGLFGFDDSEGFGALTAHSSGYFWVGYQQSNLSLFQLEID